MTHKQIFFIESFSLFRTIVRNKRMRREIIATKTASFRGIIRSNLASSSIAVVYRFYYS